MENNKQNREVPFSKNQECTLEYKAQGMSSCANLIEHGENVVASR